MRALLLASLLIVLTAVAAPHLFSAYMEGRPSSAAEVSAEPAASEERPAAAEESSSPDSVRIDAAADGHFYVDAEINFRSVRMMVDTGATVIALRESDAATAGIRVRHADFAHQVQTANGSASAAEAYLDSVAIADIEIGDVRALILPDDRLKVSLLGGSFLGRLKRFEVADGTLVLEN